jgi:hypothetical protein
VALRRAQQDLTSSRAERQQVDLERGAVPVSWADLQAPFETRTARGAKNRERNRKKYVGVMTNVLPSTRPDIGRGVEDSRVCAYPCPEKSSGRPCPDGHDRCAWVALQLLRQSGL